MIYVTSSWRNEHQPDVVEALRKEGFPVYDFRNPDPGNEGFHWSWIDKNWQNWDLAGFRGELQHGFGKEGYKLDIAALNASDALVLVMPCGRSAHIEAGIAMGRGKCTVIYFPPGVVCDPELMYAGADLLSDDMAEVVGTLDAHGVTKEPGQ